MKMTESQKLECKIKREFFMSLKFRISPEDIQMCRCIIRHCRN